MTSKVRGALLNDTEAILTIQKENMFTAVKETGVTLENTGFLMYPLTLENIKLVLEAGDHHPLLVATEEGSVTGYLFSCNLLVVRSIKPEWGEDFNLIEDCSSAFEGDTCLYLRHIAVKPSAKGKGIGKNLLAELLNKAPKLGYKHIVAEILHEPTINRISISFHQHAGFRNVGTYKERNSDLVWGIYLKSF